MNTVICNQYVNEEQHSIVLTFNGTTKADIPTGKAIPIADVTSLRYLPKANVRQYWIQPTFAATLMKNYTNDAVALSIHTGTVPTGTVFALQLEWHYI